MCKKLIHFILIILAFSTIHLAFAEDSSASDDQEAYTEEEVPGQGPTLAFQENKAIDRAQQEFEDELQRLQATNSTDNTTNEIQEPQSIAKQSEELRNLEKYKNDKQYEVSRTW